MIPVITYIRSARNRFSPVNNRGVRNVPLPIEDRRQTDHVTTLTRTGLGRAMPHALPRSLAADDATRETYYYGRQSLRDAAVDTHIAHALTFDIDP